VYLTRIEYRDTRDGMVIFAPISGIAQHYNTPVTYCSLFITRNYDEPAVLVEINELHFRLKTLTAQIHDNVDIEVTTNDNKECYYIVAIYSSSVTLTIFFRKQR